MSSSEKNLLRERFSSDPDRYYRVALFDQLGFERKKCSNCQRFFWTLLHDRTRCPEQPCQDYEFLGRPPTPKSFSYVDAWKNVEDFFVKNGHQSVPRYPVVCRWRPDLYFTVASIVDFQRVEAGKVVFEFPYNPLVVPQICLRFLDIGNVGVTGRHYTSFCMIGQHALATSQGYWRDRCIELDFRLLTEAFGIPREEVSFKEDVWLGPGAFGNSLEYYVRGLELGNAVFTSFEGTPDNFRQYDEKVIDMGAGLERFVWLSYGAPNSYESSFPEVIQNLKERAGIKLPGQEFMKNYYKLAGDIDVNEISGGLDSTFPAFAKKLNIGEDKLRTAARSLEALYSVADHARTLLFAVSDGALPSNVGGGYNLRVILRRAIDFLRRLEIPLPLSEVCLWHAASMHGMFPELSEHEEDLKQILSVEEEKYAATKNRASSIIESLKKSRRPVDGATLVRLYDSEGITPETIVQAGLMESVPSDFYSKVTQRHMSARQDEKALKVLFDLRGIPPTKLIFYSNRDQFEFNATVLRLFKDRYLVLDQTAFYARAGGQEPDHGTIGGEYVSDVTKTQTIVIHEIGSPKRESLSEGHLVHGIVDERRRSLIMRHHTATHIINGACRKLIGPWVWQHSAFKDADMARLDITHFAHLSRDQVFEIERLSNQIVRQDLPISVDWVPRTTAEMTYGFRLYQGGAAPTRELRIVEIQGWDVEACSGTHCSRTGEVGLIKITKAERVQDGVERIEFAAGDAAVKLVEKEESILMESAGLLETPTAKLSNSITKLKQSEETARRSAKLFATRLAALEAPEILRKSTILLDPLKLCFSQSEDERDETDYQLALGERLTTAEPYIVYVSLFGDRGITKVMVFAGKEAQSAGVRAGDVAHELSKRLGGSGGGDSSFGQGGIQKIVGRIEPQMVGTLMKEMMHRSSALNEG